MSKETIAGQIDNEGLWYWIWQKFYRHWADEIPIEVLKELIILSDQMEEVRKLLDKNGFLI